jgi:phospholipid/cholesterol/gamma-HCH transport system substrate-binding protein
MRPRGPQPRLGRTAVAGLIAAAAAFAVYLVVSDGARLPFSSTFELRARFGDAAGLRSENHSPVTVSGVPMGTVESVEVSGGQAVATLAIDDDAEGVVRADATIRIVPRSALQDLTVDIDPGSGAPLADGTTVPAERTSTTVGADRVLDIFDADTRAQAAVLIDQLGAGLDGRSRALADDLDRLGRVVDSSTEVAAALADRRRLLVRFVDDLDSIFSRLGERQAQLAGAIAFARRTLEVTGERDGELARSTEDLPAALSRTREALDAVTDLAGPLEPALAELDPAARALPGALTALREFVPRGERLISGVSDLADRGASGVRHLREILTQLGPVARAARPAVPKAGEVVSAIDRNKEGIGVLGDRFSGVFSTNDANGPILRGLGFFEDFQPEDLGFARDARGAELRSAKLDTVIALTRVCLKENPVACLARYLVPSLPGAVAP